MFSTKAEYGVRVMVELARRAGENPDAAGSVVPLAEIAEHDGLPLAYLEHLVARLRKAGLIDSRRGSRGGYMLARPADQITTAEIVEALEGSIAPIECISQGPDGAIVCSRESRLAREGQAGQAGAGQAGGGRAGTESFVCPTKLLWTKVRFSIVKALEDTTLADLVPARAPIPAGAGASASAIPSPVTA